MNKERRKRWEACVGCHQLIYTTGYGAGHVCPTKVLAMKEAELDCVIGEELSTWDMDVKKFWKGKDVRFYEWLADNDKY